MAPPRKQRLQTATEREIESDTARREREAIPEECDEDITGQYTGPVLARMRSRRPTSERLGRLELKHDDLALTVAGMDGKVTAILDFTAKADAARESASASKWAQVPTIIKALGIAVALGIAAAMGRHGF